MKALVFSPLAQADIGSIWDYSAAGWDADQADRYVDGIRLAAQALASGRTIGRPADVKPGILKCKIASHVIYFRDDTDRIVIIRVLHGAQDVERHL